MPGAAPAGAASARRFRGVAALVLACAVLLRSDRVAGTDEARAAADVPAQARDNACWEAKLD